MDNNNYNNQIEGMDLPLNDNYLYGNSYAPFYNNRQNYNFNAPDIFNYLASYNSYIKAITDLLNRVANRDISVEDTNSIDLIKEMNWIGNKFGYDNIINLKANLKISGATEDVSLGTKKRNYTLSNLTKIKDTGIFNLDYKNVLDDLINNLDKHQLTIDDFNNRLTTIITKTDGTTPLEVIDSRNSIYGENFPTLSQHINNIEKKISDFLNINTPMLTGYYINYQYGVQVEHASGRYKISDYINVKDNKSLYLNSTFSGTSDGWAFYDDNKKYISGSNKLSNPITVPKNAVYFRFSSYDHPDNKIRLIGDYSLSNIKEYLTNISRVSSTLDLNKHLNINPNYTLNYYINYLNGLNIPIETDTFYSSDYIDVTGFDSLLLASNFSGTSDGWAFYDVNKKYISGTNTNGVITVPEKAYYFRYSVFKIDTSNVVLRGVSNIYELTKKVKSFNAEQKQNFAYGIGNAIMIGDSLTSGAYYNPNFKNGSGASINENIPYYLGRMINTTITNSGVSGADVLSWYKTQYNKFDFSKYDTVIMWLGTNNGLTDTLDIDVIQHSDYNDYAQTNTGTYCKIIEKMKAINPSINIILLNVFASSGNMNTTNTVIKKISEKYTLKLIDMSMMNSSNYPRLHPFGNNTHFGKEGNIVIANKIVKYLNDNMSGSLEFGYSERVN